MDIVLEVFDTFLFDRFWATVYPASNPSYAQNVAKHATATFSSMRELPTSIQPSTQFFQLNPSQYAYMSEWPRDNIYRQGLTLYLITWLFGLVIYFLCAGLSYLYVFDHATFTRPKYLKNQVALEIKQTMISMPLMAIFTAPPFLLEVRGYGKLYDAPSEAPFALYSLLQFPPFIGFTDLFIYWIHRGLHHPMVYKRLHKAHHKWIMPTPFASHAFTPWTVSRRACHTTSLPSSSRSKNSPTWRYDGEYIANSFLINGAACHTIHHLYFNYNYGQFTTLWDRLGGSYRQPNDELLSRESKMSKAECERQTKEVEKLQKEVEGDDDRDYGDEARRLEKKML